MGLKEDYVQLWKSQGLPDSVIADKLTAKGLGGPTAPLQQLPKGLESAKHKGNALAMQEQIAGETPDMLDQAGNYTIAALQNLSGGSLDELYGLAHSGMGDNKGAYESSRNRFLSAEELAGEQNPHAAFVPAAMAAGSVIGAGLGGATSLAKAAPALVPKTLTGALGRVAGGTTLGGLGGYATGADTPDLAPEQDESARESAIPRGMLVGAATAGLAEAPRIPQLMVGANRAGKVNAANAGPSTLKTLAGMVPGKGGLLRLLSGAPDYVSGAFGYRTPEAAPPSVLPAPVPEAPAAPPGVDRWSTGGFQVEPTDQTAQRPPSGASFDPGVAQDSRVQPAAPQPLDVPQAPPEVPLSDVSGRAPQGKPLALPPSEELGSLETGPSGLQTGKESFARVAQPFKPAKVAKRLEPPTQGQAFDPGVSAATPLPATPKTPLELPAAPSEMEVDMSNPNPRLSAEKRSFRPNPEATPSDLRDPVTGAVQKAKEAAPKAKPESKVQAEAAREAAKAQGDTHEARHQDSAAKGRQAFKSEFDSAMRDAKPEDFNTPEAEKVTALIKAGKGRDEVSAETGIRVKKLEALVSRIRSAKKVTSEEANNFYKDTRHATRYKDR